MSFDTLAPHYTWMERVLAGGRLQRSRVAWLDALDGCDRILIAGVGHGHFLRRCARRFPRTHITSVDASGGMLREARRRAELGGLDLARLEFVRGELPRWRPESAAFDGIVTHFFLDCFPPDELAAVVRALAGGATASARWLVTDFTIPAAGWSRQRARVVHALMYGFFRRVTEIPAGRFTEPDPWLSQQGFALAGRKSANYGLLRSDFWLRGLASDVR